MRRFSSELRRLADKQAGVLCVRQTRFYMTRGQVRANIDAGRWSSIGHGVFVLSTGRPSFEQRAWAALLAAPPGSALSGPTAAKIDKLDFGAVGIDQDHQIHITVPKGMRVIKQRGVVTHWSAHLGDADVHDGREPRRTRLARSVVDTASWQSNPRLARAVILIAIQSRRVSGEQIDDALTRRGSCLHHAVITESVADAAGGSTSVPEFMHTLIVRRFQLPEPTRQAVRTRENGRAYLDNDWADFGVSDEVEGVLHFHPDQRERDLDRLNELTIAGDRVLLFSSFAVRHRPEQVARVIARALISGGWQPANKSPWAPLAAHMAEQAQEGGSPRRRQGRRTARG